MSLNQPAHPLAGRISPWPLLLGGAVVVALAATSPAGPLLALGAVLLVLPGLSPWWGVLAGVVVSLGVHSDFIDHYRIPLFSMSFYATDVITLVTLASLALYALVGVRAGRPAKPSWPLLIFLLYAYAMSVLALFRDLERREVLADLRPFAHYAIALFVPSLLCTRSRLRVLLWTLLISSAVGCVYGVFHSLGTEEEVQYSVHLGFARLVGGSEGAYAPMACFGIAVLMLSRSRGLRAMAAVQIVAAGMATLLTYSRGSWMAFFAGTAVVVLGLMFLAPRRILTLAGSLLVAGTLVVAVLELRGVPVFKSVEVRSNAASGGRVDLALVQRLLEYQTVADTFRQHPWFGSGPGTLFTYFMPGRGWMSSTYTHNSFFYIGCKWGIVGLVLYLNFFLLFLWRGALALRRAQLNDRQVMLLGLMAALVALAVKSLSTWFLNIYTVSLWLAVMLGTLDLLSRPDAEVPEELR